MVNRKVKSNFGNDTRSEKNIYLCPEIICANYMRVVPRTGSDTLKKRRDYRNYEG